MACCCGAEGDDCETCGDLCIYGVSVVSPVALTAGGNPCVAGDGPSKVVPTTAFAPCNDGAQCCGGSLPPPPGTPVDNSNVSPVYVATAYASNEASVGFTNNLGATANAKATLSCNSLETGQPEFFVDIEFLVYVPSPSHPNGFPNRQLKKTARFLLPSSCDKKPGATCLTEPVNQTKKYLNTPVQFTVSNSVAGLGTWTTVFDETNGANQSRNLPCFNSILENFSATFRITELPACKIVGCNCAASIDGMKAFFDGQEFTLGTPSSITVGDTVWTHDPELGSYDFFKDTFLPEFVDPFCPVPPFTIPIESINLSLYCVGTTWLAEATTYCLPREIVDCEVVSPAYAQRLFTGHIACFEAGPGCPDRPAGTYIPLGSVQDIVEAEDSPFLNPELPDCGAPDFPDFRIEQACGA
jgi:hypothetical protein